MNITDVRILKEDEGVEKFRRRYTERSRPEKEEKEKENGATEKKH
jgi:hypothetical protein